MGLYIISGFSQSGKTTLVRELIEKNKKILKIKTATSRKPREEETNKDYHFFKKEDFKDKSRFIETAEVHGEYYGTPKEELKKIKNNKVIWLLDVQGVKAVLNNKEIKLPKDTKTIFITPDSIKSLLIRIKLRKDPNIKKRVESIKKELKYINLFKYIISTSKTISESLDDLKAIIFNNNKRIKEIEEHAKKFSIKKFLKDE